MIDTYLAFVDNFKFAKQSITQARSKPSFEKYYLVSGGGKLLEGGDDVIVALLPRPSQQTGPGLLADLAGAARASLRTRAQGLSP
jgi:hypothetical protein